MTSPRVRHPKHIFRTHGCYLPPPKQNKPFRSLSGKTVSPCLGCLTHHPVLVPLSSAATGVAGTRAEGGRGDTADGSLPWVGWGDAAPTRYPSDYPGLEERLCNCRRARRRATRKLPCKTAADLPTTTPAGRSGAGICCWVWVWAGQSGQERGCGSWGHGSRRTDIADITRRNHLCRIITH